MLALVCGNSISPQYETCVSYRSFNKLWEYDVDILNELKTRDFIVEGHFVYSSRLHGNDFVRISEIFEDSHFVHRLGGLIAGEFIADEIDMVVGRVLSATLLGQAVAYHLATLTEKKVLLFTAHGGVGGTYNFKNGVSKRIKGERILIVEDIVDSGGTAGKVVELVRRLGGKVVGVGSLCNRGDTTPHVKWDVPKFVPLVQLDGKIWSAGECRHHGPCKKQVPITLDLSRSALK